MATQSYDPNRGGARAKTPSINNGGLMSAPKRVGKRPLAKPQNVAVQKEIDNGFAGSTPKVSDFLQQNAGKFNTPKDAIRAARAAGVRVGFGDLNNFFMRQSRDRPSAFEQSNPTANMGPPPLPVSGVNGSRAPQVQSPTPVSQAPSAQPPARSVTQDEIDNGFAGTPTTTPTGTPTTTPTGNPTATPTGAPTGIIAPTQRTVTPDELAQTQLDKITSKDSASMQRAGADGARMSNRRGLLNSSMAAGAAQGAMIDRAAPIALQDAQTYARAAEGNQKYANDFSMADKLYSQDIGKMDRQAEESKLERDFRGDESQAERTLKERMQQSDEEFRKEFQDAGHNQEQWMQNKKGEQSIDLANIEAEYKQTLQTSASASEILRQYTASVGELMKTEKLPPSQLKAALDVLKRGVLMQLDVLTNIASVDLSKYQEGGELEVGSVQTTGTKPGSVRSNEEAAKLADINLINPETRSAIEAWKAEQARINAPT